MTSSFACSRAVVPALYLSWLQALCATHGLCAESLTDYPCSPNGSAPVSHYLLREAHMEVFEALLVCPARLLMHLQNSGITASHTQCEELVRVTRLSAESAGALLWQTSLMMVNPDEIFSRLQLRSNPSGGAAAHAA